MSNAVTLSPRNDFVSFKTFLFFVLLNSVPLTKKEFGPVGVDRSVSGSELSAPSLPNPYLFSKLLF